jgi:hypothetical protein
VARSDVGTVIASRKKFGRGLAGFAVLVRLVESVGSKPKTKLRKVGYSNGR